MNLSYHGLICMLFMQLVWTCYAKDLDLVQFTAEDVAKNGAVCLDGSPPAFYIRRGSGAGINKWHLHLVGGGWCFFEQFGVLGKSFEWMGCYERTKMKWSDGNNSTVGTTNGLPATLSIGGLFSDDVEKNPHFYDWNHVHVIYCDGFSFAGDREDPITVEGTKVYMRGRRILAAVLERLVYTEGMRDATDVLLSGCSSGGLGVYINADFVKSYLDNHLRWPEAGYKYKALADGGYFLDVPWDPLAFAPIDLPSFKDLLYQGAKLHGALDSLNPTCKRVEWWRKWKCVIPRYFYEYIETPVFVLNPLYDSYQVYMIKGLFCLPPDCTGEKLDKFFENRDTFLEKAEPIFESKKSGAFLNSCVIHCQTLRDRWWTTYKIDMDSGFTYSIQDAVATWYFDEGCSCGSNLLVYDKETWPSNPYCPEIVSPFD